MNKEKNEVYSAVCPKCKKEVPHIPYLIRINKGIKLISLCHDAVSKRYTRYDRLIIVNPGEEIEKELDQAEIELENENNQLNKEEMEVEQAKGG